MSEVDNIIPDEEYSIDKDEFGEIVRVKRTN